MSKDQEGRADFLKGIRSRATKYAEIRFEGPQKLISNQVRCFVIWNFYLANFR